MQTTETQPSTEWLRNRSKALLEAEQVEEALRYANQAVALGAAEYDNYWQKAECLMAKNDFDGAEQAIIAGAQMGGPYYAHHHIHSRILAKAGRFEEAIEAERRSLQNYPDYFDSLFNLACLLSELRSYEEALETFNRALRVAGPHARNVKSKIAALKASLASEPNHDTSIATVLWVPQVLGANSLGESLSEIEALGYSHNAGGLNNQKFALLGLITDAYKKKLPILLPKMTIKDHVAGIDTLVPIGEVFDLVPLFDLCKKYRITVIEGNADDFPSDPSGSYFGKGATDCGQCVLREITDSVLANLVADYFRCLTPVVKNSYIMKNLIEDVFTHNGIEVVAQFRIETDWLKHCDYTLQHELTDPEDYNLTFDQIVAKIVRTLPTVKKLLVLCDEAAVSMPKSQMADVCRTRFGVELFWKSDFLTRFELTKLNNLELSMIDFELALCSKHYIGMTRSTFSNAVTSTKHIITGKPVTGDYIYNNYGLRLARRTDNGGSLSIISSQRHGVLEQVF